MPPKRKEGAEYRETSISEFFEKNRHILGFDSLQKALFMIVKEAVDNSLDACEEYSILPDLNIEIAREGDDIYRITVADNGPGIERKVVPLVFGKLLYGSRFHSYRQSRGQQGIGITAAILYGQVTTDKPAEIITKRLEDDVAYSFVLSIDIKKNEADVREEKPVIWDREHGTLVSIRAKGRYQTGKQSVIEYIRQTAIANPHAKIIFTDPDGKTLVIQRATTEAPKPPRPIKPYPLGLELGDLIEILSASKSETLREFLQNDLSRITANTAMEIIRESKLSPEMKPDMIRGDDAKRLIEAFSRVKLMPPPPECLSRLGVDFIRKGLKNVYGEERPSFYCKPVSRPLSVYNGNPFSVEVGMVFGGMLPSDQPVRVVRFANKVPLLYQPGACAITRAVSEVDWRPYGFDQRGGQGIPFGPAIIFVHVYGIRLPYTSESKEAIAPVEEIIQEITNALKRSGRDVKTFLSKKERRKKLYEKFRLVETLLPEIARKSSAILEAQQPDVRAVMSKIVNVVYITEDFQQNGEKVTIRPRVFNYTGSSVSFELFAEIPGQDGKNAMRSFPVSSLEPGKYFEFEITVEYTLGEYPGTDYYFKGIDLVHVQGAEPLPADYGYAKIQIEGDED
ncbi:MAG: DNA topoisomerase VI subunit B [Thermoplasmataceae archaeon]